MVVACNATPSTSSLAQSRAASQITDLHSKSCAASMNSIHGCYRHCKNQRPVFPRQGPKLPPKLPPLEPRYLIAKVLGANAVKLEPWDAKARESTHLLGLHQGFSQRLLSGVLAACFESTVESCSGSTGWLQFRVTRNLELRLYCQSSAEGSVWG